MNIEKIDKIHPQNFQLQFCDGNYTVLLVRQSRYHISFKRSCFLYSKKLNTIC